MTYLVGQQLGRYTVQEEIGRGGMARVYRALDTSLKRTVALKVLAPQLAMDPEFAQRFEREAVTAANLRHPNIVTIYDVGEHNGLRYIAMEYVRGRTLHWIIEGHGALGLGFAIAIVAPVAAALDYAHSQGAVHRDIKPQNIMIDTDGRVLLTDFGIAQAPDPDGDSRRLTRTGIFMGTPEYISPEQASAQRVDGRSDLYSLGIATYEVITGSVPFSGATPQLIVAHAQKPPPPPSSLDPNQPPELDLVMARILAKQPDQRFATGAGLVEGLRSVARKHGVAVATQRELAALMPTRPSTGESSVVRSREPQPPAAAPAVVPPLMPRAGSSDPTQIGQAAGRAPDPAPPPARGTSAPGATPESLRAERAAFVNDRETPPRRATRTPLDEPETGNRGTWVIVGLLGGLLLVVLFVVFRSAFSTGRPNVAPTRAPAATTFPTQVSATPTPRPTATPVPSATAAPTAAPAEPSLVPIEPSPVPVEPSPVPIEPSPVPIEPSPEPPTPEPPTAEPPTPEPPTAEPPTAAATSPPATSTPEKTPTTAISSPSPGPTAAATVSSPPPSPTATTAPATATTEPSATPTPTLAPSATPTITPGETPSPSPTVEPSATPRP